MNNHHQVVVIEDDPHTRTYLAEAIDATPELQVIGTAGCCADALVLLRKEPDIALIDLGLPDGSGLDVIRERVNKKSKTEFVVITVFGDESHVIPALEAGASGYLLKDSAMPDIAALIAQVLNGGSPISPIIARKLLKRFHLTSNSKETIRLTNREFEILNLMAKGYTPQETAGYLYVSYHTVVAHIRHIYEKLEVSSRTEAVFEASRRGLIKL
ncbi:MAG: response regulator transcription factor [Mariprofundaceae bacterium]|nr:response regulator transcription factor [Mariprofundaceae bacterium]